MDYNNKMLTTGKRETIEIQVPMDEDNNKIMEMESRGYKLTNSYYGYTPETKVLVFTKG